ncbi:MAG: hypothetical protein ACKVQW_04295 [Pyrinomonadaceae bacterium]
MKKEHKRIEIRRRSEPISRGGAGNDLYDLLIDGAVLNVVSVGENYKSSSGLPNFYIISKQRDSLQKIAALTLNEFMLARVQSIHLTNWTRWEGFDISISLGKDHFPKHKEGTTFEVEFEPDVENWKYPYSYNDYYTRFRQICETEFGERVLFGVGGIKTKFMSVIDAVLNNLSIAEEVEKNLEQFVEIHKITLKQLEQEQFKNSLLTSFSFPDELKAPCEQYLLYFAQFLRDLGINATPNLKEEAGKVLFSVTPNDDIEAFDKIREALSIYLHLPSSPIVYDDSFAAMRLQQEVENLHHSQTMAVREIRSAEREMRLAQSVIEHQDKIISHKDSIIEQQNRVIEKISSKSIMIDALEDKEGIEELYDGLKVGESKWVKELTGIQLNPAKVIKTVVKNTFGKSDEKKSVLGLDEDSDKKDI